MFSLKEAAPFLPLRLGVTAADTLQEFIDIDVSADDLVRILNRNGVYKNLFASFVQQKTGKTEAKEGQEEQASPTHRLIGLLGMLGSRNLILALRMHRAVDGRFPIDEEGKLEVNAPDSLKRALEVEDIFSRLDLDYSETAYAGAVYYDWMFRIASQGQDFKKLEPYFQEIWKRAQRTGFIAHLLAQHMPSVPHKFAAAAGMLLHAGKLHLALRFPDAYPDFERDLDKNDALTPVARLLLEREKWGWSQEEIGAHSLHYFGLFQNLIPAIRHFREPYYLKDLDQGAYTFTSLLWLAESMGRSWRIPANDADPVFADWAHPSVRNLKLPKATLIDILKTAMAIR